VESSIAERQSASGNRCTALKAESAIPAICLALSLLNQPLPSPAATITNYLNAYGWLQYALIVNAGDTVWWVNQQDPFYYGTNYFSPHGKASCSFAAM
jgi:hypothetical protein